MLTEIQKQELQELLQTCSPEFKPIFEAAFPRWISGEIEPKQEFYGIKWYNEKEFTPRFDKKCCLIGTALIGKKINDDLTIQEEVINAFGVVCNYVIKTFDGHSDCLPDVVRLREILFGE